MTATRSTQYIFLLLGPPVGALVFVTMDQILAFNHVYQSGIAQPMTFRLMDVWPAFPVLWLYALLLAYPLGLAPAALSLFLYKKALARKSQWANRSFGVSGLIVGLSTSALFGLVLAATYEEPVRMLPWAAAGAIAGGLCGWVDGAGRHATVA